MHMYANIAWPDKSVQPTSLTASRNITSTVVMIGMLMLNFTK